MTDEFALFHEVVSGRHPQPADVSSFAEACNRRLLRALEPPRWGPGRPTWLS